MPRSTCPASVHREAECPGHAATGGRREPCLASRLTALALSPNPTPIKPIPQRRALLPNGMNLNGSSIWLARSSRPSIILATPPIGTRVLQLAPGYMPKVRSISLAGAEGRRVGSRGSLECP